MRAEIPSRAESMNGSEERILTNKRTVAHGSICVGFEAVARRTASEQNTFELRCPGDVVCTDQRTRHKRVHGANGRRKKDKTNAREYTRRPETEATWRWNILDICFISNGICNEYLWHTDLAVQRDNKVVTNTNSLDSLSGGKKTYFYLSRISQLRAVVCVSISHTIDLLSEYLHRQQFSLSIRNWFRYGGQKDETSQMANIFFHSQRFSLCESHASLQRLNSFSNPLCWSTERENVLSTSRLLTSMFCFWVLYISPSHDY